jgi:hypothetical protein
MEINRLPTKKQFYYKLLADDFPTVEMKKGIDR